MSESYGVTSQEFAADNLFAGDSKAVQKSATIFAGSGALTRGTVLGKIKLGAGTIAAGTNTGNGAAGAVTVGKKAKVGVYALTCITAATNAGKFQVIDPDGYRMADLTVAAAYNNGHFAVTIADGSTDFIVGDTFTVTIAAGSGKYRAYAAANTDGSGEADCILDRDIDATSADQVVAPYATGEFNEAALTGIDAAGKVQLEAKGIFCKTVR
jgi:hypothetical protein